MTQRSQWFNNTKTPLTPSSLNDDELNIIFQYLNVLDVKSINTLSLVNKRFFSLATSDRYWTEFENVQRISGPLHKPKPKRTLLIEHKRRNEYVNGFEYDKRFYAGTMMLATSLVIILLPFIMLMSSIFEYVLKSASCHRYSISNSTETLYDIIPFPNTTCIPYQKNLTICNETNSFYPCCVELSGCTFDKTPTGLFKWTFEIRTEVTMQSDRYKFIQSNQYKCGEGKECNPLEYEDRYFDCYYNRDSGTPTEAPTLDLMVVTSGFVLLGVIVCILSIGTMLVSLLRGVISYCIVEMGLAEEHVGERFLIYTSKYKIINKLLIITGLNQKKRKKYRAVKSNQVVSLV